MLSILMFYASQFGCYVLSLARTPAFAVVGYILIYFLYDRTRWWYFNIPEISYSFFMSATILFLAIVHKNKSPSIFKERITVFLCLLGIYFLLANFWAVSSEIHEYDASNFIKVLLVIVASIKLVNTRNDLNIVIWSYIAGSAYIGFYILETGRTSYGRVEGIGVVDAPDVNGLAASLVIGTVFCLYYFWVKKGFAKFAAIIAGALIVNALVLMNSRGAFLGVFIGAGWFVFHLYRSKVQIKYKKLKVILLVLTGVSCLAVVLDQSAIERMLSIKEESTLTKDKQTGSTRVFFWLASVEMSFDYPFGGGARSFILLSPNYIPEDIDTGGSKNRAVHSTWFQGLTEVGYPGMVIFMGLLLATFFSLRRVVKRAVSENNSDKFLFAIGLEGAFFGYLTAITFLDRFRGLSLYLLILMVVAFYRIDKQDSERLTN
ncbi:O-antigen ligase family protein [Alteromonas macleodii]|uniref:O-antigen ligase family protein n=1 Tax=Alteromonas macleodii TaxID=28108 RepID=UPI000C6C2343|nr:hypothetical protein [Halomonas sp.]